MIIFDRPTHRRRRPSADSAPLRWSSATSRAIIEFPDAAAARSWYGSAAYRAILRYRTDHVDSDAIIVEGVGADYDPRATASRLRDEIGS